MQLDHLAVVCRDIETGVQYVEQALGVPLQPGGKHAHFGTHNKLLSLGPGLYLEVISPDPAANVAIPRWFDLDHAPDTPKIGNWIVRLDDVSDALESNPRNAGETVGLQRENLIWDISVPADGSLPDGGGWPTMIAWKSGGHPADRLPDQGVRLTKLQIAHPDADTLAKALLPHLQDPRITHVVGAEIGITAIFMTENGPRSLG